MNPSMVLQVSGVRSLIRPMNSANAPGAPSFFFFSAKIKKYYKLCICPLFGFHSARKVSLNLFSPVELRFSIRGRSWSNNCTQSVFLLSSLVRNSRALSVLSTRAPAMVESPRFGSLMRSHVLHKLNKWNQTGI